MNLNKALFLIIAMTAAVGFPAHARIQSSPVGASAECADGKYSTSSGSGTCSSHGGVRRWLNRKPDPSFPPMPPSRQRQPRAQSNPSPYYYPRYNTQPQPQYYYYPQSAAPTPTPKPALRSRSRIVKQNVTLPSEFTVRVVGVHDGDTVTVLYLERYKFSVRLYGIDAPEDSQPFNRASRKLLSTLVYRKDVKIYSKGKDKYGRLLGWVFRGPTCINKEMVLTGNAWWYRQYAKNENGLRDAERIARQRKVGLWAAKSPVGPWNWRKR